MTTPKQSKRWFTREDIELAKQALSELPDLTAQRLTKGNVLDELKTQIIELSSKKGYSADDIKSALEAADIHTSIKSIRDIISSNKKPRRVSRAAASSVSTNDKTNSEV
ncbi:molybdopterin-guanine dinucleotide biosynthesis protein MobC [Salmonella enterica]|nr:molybdopterin-guanine dinucleotide biosynthesis protein MobC [Salmonella enterica]